MIKHIKVDDQVYNELDQLRASRQTFSEVVAALLKGRIKVLETMDALESPLKYREWQAQRLREAQAVRE